MRLNGVRLKVHDGDVDEMPIHRFQGFNLAVMVEAGIGSDMSAFDGHLVKMKQYILRDMKAEFEVEVDSIRQCLYFIINGVSPKMQAFVYLIEEIDGERLEDFSPENVARITERLGKAGLTARMIDGLLSLVKKNADDELVLRFPKMFGSAKQSEFNHRVLDRSRFILDSILRGDDPEVIEEQVEVIDDGLFRFQKPVSYSGKDGLESRLRISYENTSALVSEMMGRDSKTLTVMEYYTNVRILEERQKAATKKKK